MTPRWALVITAAATVAVSAAQQPQIQNGRVETRQGSSIASDIAAIGAGSADPAWVAWRVPMIDGRRDNCGWYNFSDDNTYTSFRGIVLETDPGAANRPKTVEPTGAVPLELGTHLMVLARVVNKRVERVRSFSDDCPLDANGRTVYWLDKATPADSLSVLEGRTHPDYATMTRGGADNLVSDALAAISLHRDAGADAILDRLASGPDSNLRKQAAAKLGSARGAHGFDTLRRLLDSEKQQDVRRSFVDAIAGTRQPQTADALLALARTDTDPVIRAEAVYYVPARGGASTLPDILKIIDTDFAENVRQRAVSGIGQLPDDGGVPTLIQLAKDSKDAVVRKQAVTQLTRSKDARAVAFLQSLIR